MNRFTGLESLDVFLIGILIISLGAKIIKEFIVFILWKRWSEQDKARNKACLFLKEQDGKFVCENYLYKHKCFINDRCKKDKCRGYRMRNQDVKQLIYSHGLLTSIYILIDWTSQLSTIVLIIRALLKNS